MTQFDCLAVEETQLEHEEQKLFSFHYCLFLHMTNYYFPFTDGPKDTSPEDTLEKTYVPSLKTLEEEVMEKMGIVETRRPRRSYWY